MNNLRKRAEELFEKIVNPREPIIGLDIGGSTLKLIELDLTPRVPVLKAIGVMPTPAECISGHYVKDPQKLAEGIQELLRLCKSSGRAVAIAVPGSSVFVKTINVSAVARNDLRDQVILEAAQYVPYDINSVALDFHVLGSGADGTLDVVVVAVKNDMLAGYIDAAERAGLEVSVVDVDYFAVQTCFEYSQANAFASTTAVIDVGARYSTIHIVRAGRSLCFGDLFMGAHTAYGVATQELGCTIPELEAMLRQPKVEQDVRLMDICDRAAAGVVSEIEKQVSLLCSSADDYITIDSVRLTGGGSVLPGLRKQLGAELQRPISLLQPFSEISVPQQFSAHYLESVAPLMGVSLGLALRCPGDQVVPEFLE